MEAIEYSKLAQYEGWYWWYRAERRALLSAAKSLRLPPHPRILDMGCGTGRNLTALAELLGAEGHGVDISKHAAALWNSRSPTHQLRATANHLPYTDETFDAVFNVDLLQCMEVDPLLCVREMARVLKPRGRAVMLAPAYQWLLSRHDQAVHSIRRFTRRGLHSLLASARLRVEETTHLFWPFFPIIAATRLWGRWARNHHAVQSDLAPISPRANKALYAVAVAEQYLARRFSAPFGTTIMTVARKDER